MLRGLGGILEAAGGGSIVYEGYDDCYVSKAGKMGIGHSMAAACGLDAGVYVGKAAARRHTVALRQESDVEEMLFASDSPACGILFGEVSARRGYMISEREGAAELLTHCYYIEAGYDGRVYNRWVPCAPEDVEWRYEVLELRPR